MSIAFVVAACRREITHLAKSIVRLLVWGILMFMFVLIVFVLLPQAWVALVGAQTRQFFDAQRSVAFGLMAMSLGALYGVARGRSLDWRTWVGTHGAILALGIAAVFWVPQSSGYIVGIALALLVFTPNVLGNLARRRVEAGYRRAAAFYARLACFFHPSRAMRFQSSLLAAQILGSIEERVAAYKGLALHAAPEQSEFLNCSILVAQDDWEGVLERLRRTGDKLPALIPYKIRALGELGRLDEMIATYASAESALRLDTLPSCRLFVMAFSGRADAVHSLLSKYFRSFSSRDKAYWIFIAAQAAGAEDDEARRVLVSLARDAGDETFRRRAQRHLDAAATRGGPVLSTESLEIIAILEAIIRKASGKQRFRS